ncbi:ATP-binding protein [Actinoplanes sp. NPDC049599]|uniref:sensor histidine kinase n=1 Tax=Actinoplanes sp. NPDC049599 TaxID=3363903 RepID=UPI0037A24C96
MKSAPTVEIPAGGQPRARERRSRIVVLVIALGLVGTVLAALALRRTDEERLGQALDERTAMVSQTLTNEIKRYTTSLLDLAAAVGAQAQLMVPEFDAMTAATDRQRLPGATGIALVVPATGAQVDRVQAAWRRAGSPDLRLRPAPGHTSEHLFVVLSRTIDGTGTSAGEDLAAAPEAAAALSQAREGHQVAISASYRLLQDAEVPPEAQQLGFVVAAPVYATSPSAPDAGRFRGWMVMGLRGGEFLRDAVGRIAGDAVAVTLADPSTGVSVPVGRLVPDTGVDGSRSARTVPIALPQRTWELTVAPTDRVLLGADLHLDVVAALIGMLITALLAALTGTVVTSRNRALRRVDQATVALREDINRREAVEQQLRRREEELIGFAGVVAHDLRSPLARITGYADFLREEAAPRLEPAHRDFLERLYSGAQRMQSLIDDLLDYATADNQTLVSTRVDLNRLVAEVIRDRVNGAGEQQPAIVLWPLPTVEGDPVLLRQVIDNLVGNALKYTPAGQHPDIEISGRPLAEGGWRIELADRGIGIPAAQRESVFTPFTRADGSQDYHGTGLGLAIVHRIIERHHGRVGVEENPGGGSRFWFTLPAESRAEQTMATGG